MWLAPRFGPLNLGVIAHVSVPIPYIHQHTMYTLRQAQASKWGGWHALSDDLHSGQGEYLCSLLRLLIHVVYV
jgi:hypothetical protein